MYPLAAKARQEKTKSRVKDTYIERTGIISGTTRGKRNRDEIITLRRFFRTLGLVAEHEVHRGMCILSTVNIFYGSDRIRNRSPTGKIAKRERYDERYDA